MIIGSRSHQFVVRSPYLQFFRFLSKSKQPDHITPPKSKSRRPPRPPDPVSVRVFPIPVPAVSMSNAVQSNAICLTPSEDALFALLREVVDGMGLGTTVRVAGGWVRDKILFGATKDDVDICLDNMTGEQFCHFMNDWAKSQGKSTFNFGVIQSNPDKSKHLATATVKINGLEVDFVNLRSETYVEHSRIPVVEFGSPLEDARRRDLTVNSLFYNIHSDAVEDFTGLGMEDMRNQILRTPLDPRTTLIDDPLRAFRVLRFACRLRFAVATPVLEACASDEVILALGAKVSRERILSEIEGTLDGDYAQASRAVFLLHRLRLLQCVLYSSRADDAWPHAVLPDGVTQPMTEAAFGTARERGAALAILVECFGHVLSPSPAAATATTATATATAIAAAAGTAIATAPALMVGYPRLAAAYAELHSDAASDKLVRRFAALTYPFDSIIVVNPRKANRTLPLSEHILQNEIRVPVKSSTRVGTIHAGADKFRVLFMQYWDIGSSAGPAPASGDASQRPDRAELGEIIKECGPLYVNALLVAFSEMILDVLLSAEDSSADSTDALIHALAEQLGIIEVLPGGVFERARGAAPPDTVFASPMQSIRSRSLLDGVLQSARCRHVISSVEELLTLVDTMSLQEIWLQPALLNGKEIFKLLPRTPKGPVMGELVKAELRWRLLNPAGDAATLSTHLETLFPDFR
jgi:tRNA nucleotidyltransferase/poly(A) polymerase